MKAKVGIPTRTVSDITGIRMGTLHYWTRSELLHPSVRGRSGRRKTMLWSSTDMVELRIFLLLRRAECEIAAIHKCLRLVRRRWNTIGNTTLLVHRGGDSFALIDASELASVIAASDPASVQVMPVGVWKVEAGTVIDDVLRKAS